MITGYKNDEKPLVSIITATYNRAEFLPFTIESVLAQTYTNYEMIIVDDGSNDNTDEVIRKYLENGRIQFYKQENKGQACARNNALRRVKGEYICFLDSDDLAMPDKLEFQVNILKNNTDIGVVYGNEIQIDKDGKVISTDFQKGYSGIIYKKMLVSNCVTMGTAMARRKCFDEMGGMNESVKVADDYELWLRFSAKYKFHYEPKVFLKYRILEDSISSDKEQRFASNKTTIENFIKKNKELLNKKDIKYTWCRFYTRKANHYAREGNKEGAIRNYITAMKHQVIGKYPWIWIIKFLIGRV